MNKLKNKNILVTGGSGFIGTNLIKKLLNFDCNIRSTLHIKAPRVKNNKIEYIYCDLTRSKDCKRVCQDIDFVFMCASNSSGAMSTEKAPLLNMSSSILINVNMLTAAAKNNVKKLLFISSSVVYPDVDYPVKEADVTDKYFEKYFCLATTNRFIEKLCEMYSCKIPEIMPTVIVRTSQCYGEYDNFDSKTSRFIPSLVRKISEKQKPLNVWGDGNDIRDCLYISDLTDGILAAMCYSENFLIVNLSSGHGYSIKEIIQTLLNIDPYDTNIKFDSTKPSMIRTRLVDNTLAKELLSFNPKVSITEGLQKTLQWYKQNPIKEI